MKAPSRARMEIVALESADSICRKKRYLDQLGQTGNVSAAMFAVDIDRRKLREWQEDERFREDEQDALAKWRDKLHYEISRLALNGSEHMLALQARSDWPEKYGNRDTTQTKEIREDVTVRFVELPKVIEDEAEWAKEAAKVIAAQSRVVDEK